MTTVLITGGNRGLGRAVAEKLVERGMTVVVGARQASDGVEAARQIGGGATSVQLDVTDPASSVKQPPGSRNTTADWTF